MIISNEYKEQLQLKHADPHTFNQGRKKIKTVRKFLTTYNPQTLIDFGCGKGDLILAIRDQYPNTIAEGYDPGVPQFENVPNKVFESLVSTDALEHVEPEMLDSTLQVVNQLFSKSAFLVIASYKSKKTLSDGRNAHLIIESFDWWKNKLEKFINGKIVAMECVPVVKTPKKGEPLTGFEYAFIIEK